MKNYKENDQLHAVQGLKERFSVECRKPKPGTCNHWLANGKLHTYSTVKPLLYIMVRTYELVV